MKKILLSCIAFFMLSVGVYAQQISGKVADNNGLPLPGVNVVSGSNNTVTDFDGNFSLPANVGDMVTFSMIGYTTQTVTAAANMTVGLKEEVNMLNEVVAIGYGTKKAGSITGAVVRIKTDDILRTPTQSAIQSIQGKAAGINIVTNDEPGANPSITIRGLSTILGGRDPFYVVDGVEGVQPSNINPNDIATIDILKDASSLAIYGQKGANGVVLITTKKGKSGEFKISFNSYYGQKEVLTKVKMADAYRFTYYSNSAFGSSTYFNPNQEYNTDWFDEITRTGEMSNNSVGISGGSDNGNYYFGLSHYTEKGILIGTNFKKTNILSKSEYKLFGDKLKVNHSINLNIKDNQPKPLSAFTNAYKQAPIVPVKYPNGRWGVPLRNVDTGLNDLAGTNYDLYNNVGNPAAQLFFHNERNKDIDLFGAISAELKVVRNLTFTSNLGIDTGWGRGYTLTPTREIYLSQNPFSDNASYASTFGTKTVIINSLQQRRSNFYNWNWDNYFTYKREFGRHDITIVAGMSRTTGNNSDKFEAKGNNVPEQSNYYTLVFASDNTVLASNSITNTHTTPIVSIAYFARLEYGFMDKYLLTGIVRREGTSSFQTEKKWGVFPSISLGWVLSKENFMNGGFFDNLKIRGGYGELGNAYSAPYNYTSFTSNSNYAFGSGQSSNPGSYVANAVDKNLTWQTLKEVDLGLDFTILNSRLSGTFDYYNRKNDDIILPIQAPFVISEGLTYVNAGEITNKGFEATLRWDHSINDDLKYWIGGNFSKNDNEVSRSDSPFFTNFARSGSLDNGEYTKLVIVGQPLGSFYVFDQIGYDSGGIPVFDDMVDGIPGLSDEDRINAGSYIPKYTYGGNAGVVYRNIDFSVDIYGVGGNKVYNGKKAQRFSNENVEYAILDDFWTPSNPNAENPKPFNSIPRPSTYYVEDGSFIRVNNITLGYTLPQMVKAVDKVRIYITAVNPFISTDYSGYSPELVGKDNANPLLTAGIELDAYPTNKTFLVGANINF